MTGAEKVRPQTPEQCAAELEKPFPPDVVHWKPANYKNPAGQVDVMPYIDVRAVVERLDFCFGPDGWKDSYRQLTGGEIECTLEAQFPGSKNGWISRSDIGSRSGHMPDPDDNLKTGYSDALKRAAVKFGVGRYLYRIPRQRATWDGKRITQPPQLPAAFIPDEYRAAGPALADQAMRLAAALCQKTGRSVDQYTAEFLTRAGYDLKTAFAQIRRRDVARFMQTVTDDGTQWAASKLPETYPQNARELASRVDQQDAKLAKAGHCEPGALKAFLAAQCLAADLDEQDVLALDRPENIRRVVDWVKKFTAAKEKATADRKAGPKSNPPAKTPETQTAS